MSTFTKRRKEQLEQAHAARRVQDKREEFLSSVSAIETRETESTKVTAEPLGRRLATEYYAVTKSWMHKFGTVRKDSTGYFIKHSDNPDAWRMKIGDLIQDVALNTTPYWTVVANKKERVSLKPTNANPLLSGIGAGGALMTEHDIQVFTGQYEKENTARILKYLQDNKGKLRDISDVKYILKGTVPVNFGPNDAQGGWYNPNDIHSSRGGRAGLTPEEIVIEDARFLAKLGFKLSHAVLTGKVPVEMWRDFVDSPVALFRDWLKLIPHDDGVFVRTIQAWADRRELLDDSYRRDYWLNIFPAEVSARVENPSAFTLFALDAELVARSITDIAKILLSETQYDIQARCAAICMMARASSRNESEIATASRALRLFIKSGKGYWSLNEQIILFADEYILDGLDLLLTACRLPDADNRAYVYRTLGRRQHGLLLKAVYKEKDPRALRGVIDGLLENGYMPIRAVVYYIVEYLSSIVLDTKASVYQHYDAHEALTKIAQYAESRQDLNVEKAVQAFAAQAARIKGNPPRSDSYEKLHENLDWLNTTVDYMLRYLGQYNDNFITD